MAYLQIALRKNLFIDSLVENLKKKNRENAECQFYNFFQVYSFKFLVKKAIVHFHVTTATEICMNEVIDSCLRRPLWRTIMQTLKALTSTIIVLNLVSKGLSFYFIVMLTGPSISCRAMIFIVPFIDSSNRPVVT